MGLGHPVDVTVCFHCGSRSMVYYVHVCVRVCLCVVDVTVCFHCVPGSMAYYVRACVSVCVCVCCVDHTVLCCIHGLCSVFFRQ